MMSDYKEPVFTGMEEIEIALLDSGNIDFFTKFFPPEARLKIETDEASALGAVADGVACGAIVYSFDGGVVEMESLFVAPGYRRQYIGSTLFCEMAEFFEQNAELGAQIIRVDYMDDNSGSFQFLQSLGFEQHRREEQAVSIRVAELRDIEFAGKDTVGSGEIIVPLSQLSPAHLRGLDAELDRKNVNFTGVPVSAETVLTDISMAHYKDGEPVGCVCFSSGSSERELILSVFYAGSHSIGPTVTMLNASIQAIAASRDADVTVKVPLIQPSAARLADRLLGQAGGVCETMCGGVFFLGAAVGGETREDLV